MKGRLIFEVRERLFKLVVASFLISLIAAVAGSGCSYGRGVERREIFKKSFSREGISVFDIANVNGLTKLIPVSATSEIEVEAHIYVSILESHVESAAVEIRKIQVNIAKSETDPRALQVRVQYPEKRETFVVGAWVDFFVKVPEGLEVRSVNNNGSLESGSMKGTLFARLVNGAFKSEGHTGTVEVESINGSMDIMESKGAFKLNTQNGNVNLFLDDGAIDIRTLNGSVNAAIKRLSGSSKIQTTNGFVSVKCFEAPNFKVEGSSEIGTVTLDPSIYQGTEEVLVIKTKIGGIVVNP
jgi:hypothetical protein